MDSRLLVQLEELNVPQNEAKVYLALLDIGQTSAGEVIRRTGLHRSVVYESLDRLIDRKLVYKLEKQKIAHFQATNPVHLAERTKAQHSLALDLVPLLTKLVGKKSPEITIYEGLEAYKRYWVEAMNRLPEGSTDYVAGSLGSGWYDLYGKSAKKLVDIHIKRKIKWHMIVFDKDEVELNLKKRYPELHQYRYVPGKSLQQGNFNVFGDDTVVLQSIKEPMVIEIRNKVLAQVMKNIFDILWDSGQRI
ncbi:MAG: helix-turn-helix domain-containing protein [Candidatus Berkelbacteria bacterium]|nr:helix-turn-helix domain-containing protein [Candidatus Berkelbacteria bacterium]